MNLIEKENQKIYRFNASSLEKLVKGLISYTLLYIPLIYQSYNVSDKILGRKTGEGIKQERFFFMLIY